MNAVLLLLLLPSSTIGFAPHRISRLSTTSFLPASSTTRRRNRSSIAMLVEPSGRDPLEQLSSSPPSSPSILNKTPPVVLKIASLASIPVSFAAGLLFTPSRRLAAHALGGLATATLGTVTKSRLDDLTSSAALPALARVILENDLGETDVLAARERVEWVRSSYSVTGEDFKGHCALVYKLYLLGGCKNPVTKTSDKLELETLRQVLDLENIDVGDAHAEAARDLWREIGTFTPESELMDDPMHPDRMKIDKCLFLSERAFSSNEETDEAFVFEMSRVAKAFKLDYDGAMLRVEGVAEPFYERAMSSTRTKLWKVSSEMLLRARESLGIRKEKMMEMHLASYADEVKALLKEDGFMEGAEERLEQLQSVLELSDDDAAYERFVEVSPAFQNRFQGVIDAVVNGTEVPQGVVEETQKCLSLTNERMMPLLDSLVVQTLGKPLEEAQAFLNVKNNVNCFDSLLNALNIQRALFGLLQQSNLVESLEERYFDPSSKSSANGFLSPTDRRRLYDFALEYSLTSNDNNLTGEAKSNLEDLATYLGMSEDDTQDASRGVCGPLMENALKSAAFEITGDDFTPALLTNLKERIDNLASDLNIPSKLLKDYGRNVFRDSLKVVAMRCPSGIPSETQHTQLNSLVTLLSLTKEEVSRFYVQTFGPVYKKSIQESMGSTGVILPEYRGALTSLRTRLGISDEKDAKMLWQEAAGERMTPMIKLLANELERSLLTREQLSQKRGVDMGEDVFKGGQSAKGTTLGIAAGSDVLVSDAMSLVDFYAENDLAEVDPVTNETHYPLTAINLAAVDGEMAQALFRQFVVSGFGAPAGDPKVAMVDAKAQSFGSILGLKLEHQAAVRQNIASLIYDNFVSNALKSKPALDQQDMMFLANVQTKLNVTSDKSEEMLVDCQKKFIKDQMDDLWSNVASLTGDQVKTFRERVMTMGMDLKTDVQVAHNKLVALFQVEVKNAIETSLISPESTTLLSEIQESLGLEVSEAESALGALVTSVVKLGLEQIDREILRGRDENAVGELEVILKFLQLVQGETGLGEDDLPGENNLREKIVNIWDNSGRKKEGDLELLRGLLSLDQ